MTSGTSSLCFLTNHAKPPSFSLHHAHAYNSSKTNDNPLHVPLPISKYQTPSLLNPSFVLICFAVKIQPCCAEGIQQNKYEIL
ncbi:hypothetical protein EYC84_007179 [Monilinia fructicola]|uniref:Uncharacterized protein n=1 Tax=Monilinia fructicola TaxID=38448 RepID=A0A5M9K5T1_MONFR|nr:hypothetical protein EYC84_007179 [Monilinia fructicola]